MTDSPYDTPPLRRPRKTAKRKDATKPSVRPKRELGEPVAIELLGEAHPNAFLKVPKGTKVTVQWPKL